MALKIIKKNGKMYHTSVDPHNEISHIGILNDKIDELNRKKALLYVKECTHKLVRDNKWGQVGCPTCGWGYGIVGNFLPGIMWNEELGNAAYDKWKIQQECIKETNEMLGEELK